MKQDTVINRFGLIEDQIGVLEYFLLSDPCDRVDLEFAARFADVRRQLAAIRVQYTEAKQNNIPAQEREYELGAPRFGYDEF